MSGRHPSWKQIQEWKKRGFTPRRRPFAIDPIELLRPDHALSWPCPLSIEQAFEAMAEIVRRAHLPGYVDRLQWGTSGPIQQISSGTGLSAHEAEPIRSLADLRDLFHQAYLGRDRSLGARRWRAEQGVNLATPLTVPTATYREYVGLHQIGFACDNDVRATLARMLGGGYRSDGTTSPGGDAGTRMAVSLNGCHPDCRTLHGTTVHVGRSGRFRFVLSYGDRHPLEHGSRWGDTIARSRPGESFLDTLARARDVHDLLVHGRRFHCPDVGAAFDALLDDHTLWPWWIRMQVAGTLDGSWTNDELRPEDEAFSGLRAGLDGRRRPQAAAA